MKTHQMLFNAQLNCCQKLITCSTRIELCDRILSMTASAAFLREVFDDLEATVME